jgi:hypothetical protein
VERKPKKNHWLVAALVGVISMGLLVAVVWSQMSSDPQPDSTEPAPELVVREDAQTIDPASFFEASASVGNAMVVAQAEHLELARETLERSKSRPKRAVAPKKSKAEPKPAVESPKREPPARVEKVEPAEQPISKIEKYRREQAERLKREGEKAKETIQKDVRDKIRERMRDFKY